MSERELYDDFMAKYTMPSLTVMGGKDTEHQHTDFVQTSTHTVIRHRTRSGHDQDPWISWTHDFDAMHKPRSYSGVFSQKPSSMDLDRVNLEKKDSGFFQRIKDTFHL
jgi:hypothetical protein